MKWRVLLVVAVLAALAVWMFQRRAQLSAVIASGTRPPAAPDPQAPVGLPEPETVEGEREQPPADTETSYHPNRAWERIQAEMNGGNGAGHIVPPNAVYETDWPGNPGDDARYRAPTPEVFDVAYQPPYISDWETRQSAFVEEVPNSADFRTL